MRMSCCFASSRENTMTFFGVPSSPERTRRTDVLPIEPVPPVTRILLSWKIMRAFRWMSCASSSSISLPRRRLVAKDAAKARRVEAAVDARLVRRHDLDSSSGACAACVSRSSLLIGAAERW